MIECSEFLSEEVKIHKYLQNFYGVPSGINSFQEENIRHISAYKPVDPVGNGSS